MSLKEQLNNLAQKFQQGGQVASDWKQTYSNNPYFKDREDWGDKLGNKFPNGKNTVKDSIYAASKYAGVDPGLLYTSAMEEGMKLALTGQDTFERRSGYNEYRKANPKGAQEFPVDGGYFYGLNTFGDKYGKTIKRSLLPSGFKYTPYEQKDSQGNTLYTSAAFRSHDDAIAAKAAMMKQVEGAMTARLQKNNITLSPEARKFFDMVGYNMGEDKTIDMIKSYQEKGYLKDDKFLDPKFQPVSWKEPYTNVQRRYQNYKILNEQGYFKDYQNEPLAKNSSQQTENFQKGGIIKSQLNNLAQKFQVGGCVDCDEPHMMQKGGVYDDMSFGKAFQKAMKSNGEGGNFTWRGKDYKLEYKQEPSTNKPDRVSNNAPINSVVSNNQSVSNDTISQSNQNLIEEVIISNKKLPTQENRQEKPISFNEVKLGERYYSTSKTPDSVVKSNDSIRENAKVNNVIIPKNDKGEEIFDENGNLQYEIKSQEYLKTFNDYIKKINDSIFQKNDESAPVVKTDDDNDIQVGMSKLNFLRQNGETGFVREDGVWKKVTNNVRGDVDNILSYEREMGGNSNFAVVDKKTQKISIFDKSGKKIKEEEIMLGKGKGDQISNLYIDPNTGKSTYDATKDPMTTAAGIFTIGEIHDNYKGYLTEEPLYFLNDESGRETQMAMHAPANQKRADVLNNNNKEDNRITFGCIAGKCGFMKNIHKQRLLKANDRIYVTPEDEGNYMEYKNGKLKTIMSDKNLKKYKKVNPDGTLQEWGNNSTNSTPKTVLDLFNLNQSRSLSTK